MGNVSISTPALRQIDRIVAYIARDNPFAADRALLRIHEVIDHIGAFPDAGRQTLVRGLRMVPVVTHPYAIYFRIIRGGIRITAVRHMAQQRPGLRDEARAFAH